MIAAGQAGFLIGAGAVSAYGGGLLTTQQSVNWEGYGKGAVIGGISGAVMGAALPAIGFAGSSYLTTFSSFAGSAMLGDAVGQGVELALGWRDSYDTTQTAKVGITAGVFGVAGKAAGQVLGKARSYFGATADDVTNTVSQRVRANIEASRAARQASNFDQHLRFEKAYNFYRTEAGWGASRTLSHLRGIDFTKPVNIATLPARRLMIQYIQPEYGLGNYFANVGTPASQLGINPASRIPVLLQSSSQVRALQSTAKQVLDTWTIPGKPYLAQGNGIQYFVPNKSIFKPVLLQ